MEILQDVKFWVKPARGNLFQGYELNHSILSEYIHENILWFPKSTCDRREILIGDLGITWAEANSHDKTGAPNMVEINKGDKKLFLYDHFGSEKEVFPRGQDHAPAWRPLNLEAFLSKNPSAGLSIHSTSLDCFDFVDLNTLTKITPSSDWLMSVKPSIAAFWGRLLRKNLVPNFTRDITTPPEGVIFLPHLGLGDMIICFGAIQHLSENFNKVLVPCHAHNKEQLDYAFQENPKVEFFSVSIPSWRAGMLNLVKQFPTFRPIVSGTENNMVMINHNFAPSFYHFWQLSYSLSLTKFRLPKFDERQNILADHLKKIYNISGDYSICSAEWSRNKEAVDLLSVNLKGHECKHPLIYIKQSENIFNNMFLLKELVLGAKQVFYIDSAFAHFLERINYQGEAYLVRSLKGKPYPFLSEVWRAETSFPKIPISDWPQNLLNCTVI
jgi:hypothetical protein